jgi:hypothetical protein
MFTVDESNIFLRISETKRKQYKFDKVFAPSSTQGIESEFQYDCRSCYFSIVSIQVAYDNMLR